MGERSPTRCPVVGLVYGGRVFFWRSDDEGLTRAFTSRSGGVSTAPYAALNLGAHVGDDPAAVQRNRALLSDGLGLPEDRVVYMDQCHGAEVAVVDARTAAPPAVDALVTTEADLALVSMVADCVPLLFSDPLAGVIAAVHAGRPGMLAGVVPAAIATMRELAATDISAVVGPSVCGRCYEVPEKMRAHAGSVRPESVTVSWTGTPAIDVAAGVVAQLHDAGIPVQWVPGCAREDRQLFSHRRDGVTGRFAGVIVRRSRSSSFGEGARS